MTTTVTIEVAIPSHAVLDAIISGVGGGIQHWAKVLTCWFPTRYGLKDASATDLRVICQVLELDSGRRISLEDQWAAALRLMAERHPQKFAELITGTGDFTTGDVLIQLAAFGEVRYG